MFVFDSIHGQIHICQAAKRIIDTSAFQRLRSIKQLGGISSVFITANHTRFEHSIGVYHLATKQLEVLSKQVPIGERQKELVSVGALCHDLGHGPYSHLFDEYLNGLSNHEERSVEIFKYINNKYDLGYNEYEINFIKNIIDPDYDEIEVSDSRKYLYQIVHNDNGIDVDRFDYLIRDCYNSGIKYSFELEQIMNNTLVQNNELVYSEKARCSINSFFHARYTCYRQLCNNATVIAIEYHIKEVFKEVDEIFKITESIKNEDWEQYLLLNDNMLSTIEFVDDPQLNKASEILKEIKHRNILKLVGEVVSDHELDIVSDNKNIVIIKTKIKYHSKELPKYVSDNRVIINMSDVKYPDEHITKIMCKDKNNPEANKLFKKIPS
jgi:deoxynucleoside triphosphate triphosphohydrolase SAMHD1